MFFKNNQRTIHPAQQESATAQWLEEEVELDGQLAIDVYQDEQKIVVKSTMAGVSPDDLKISLHNDLLTIKGKRETENKIKEEDYLYRECYWGSFSRSIILPADIDSRRVEAELENGVLTLKLYKNKANHIEVKLKD